MPWSPSLASLFVKKILLFALRLASNPRFPLFHDWRPASRNNSQGKAREQKTLMEGKEYVLLVVGKKEENIPEVYDN